MSHPLFKIVTLDPPTFAVRVTLGKSIILTLRFPWIRTLTKQICVSDIGGPKALVFYRPDMASSLIYWLAGLDTSPLVFF